jgi:hypothetical protein
MQSVAIFFLQKTDIDMTFLSIKLNVTIIPYSWPQSRILAYNL